MSDLINIATPVGELYYVNISGQGKQNYNEDGYNYVATVNLSGDKAEKLKTTINEVLGEVKKGETLKSKGYRELLGDDEVIYTPTKNTAARDALAKPTGIFAFTFSTQTTFDDGKTKKISVFNSANPPIRINIGDKKIGNGSEGALSGKCKRYSRGPTNQKDVGVSLFLNAVQLTKFVEYVEDAGFEAQEGGFTGEGESFDPATAETEATATVAASTPAKPKL